MHIISPPIFSYRSILTPNKCSRILLLTTTCFPSKTLNCRFRSDLNKFGVVSYVSRHPKSMHFCHKHYFHEEIQQGLLGNHLIKFNTLAKCVSGISYNPVIAQYSHFAIHKSLCYTSEEDHSSPTNFGVTTKLSVSEQNCQCHNKAISFTTKLIVSQQNAFSNCPERHPCSQNCN